MLSKKRRVSTALFPKAIKTGRQISFGHFSFKWSKDPGAKESRFSFVVSSGVSKKATKRNLIKRRGYSIIKKYDKTLTKAPIIGIFFARKGTEGMSYETMEKEIVHLLKGANIL